MTVTRTKSRAATAMALAVAAMGSGACASMGGGGGGGYNSPSDSKCILSQVNVGYEAQSCFEAVQAEVSTLVKQMDAVTGATSTHMNYDLSDDVNRARSAPACEDTDISARQWLIIGRNTAAAEPVGNDLRAAMGDHFEAISKCLREIEQRGIRSNPTGQSLARELRGAANHFANRAHRYKQNRAFKDQNGAFGGINQEIIRSTQPNVKR